MDLFPTIRFTSEQETRPLFFRSPALFSNQVAMFFSDAEEERVRKELKAIEQSAGRRPEDKKEEKVSLDKFSGFSREHGYVHITLRKRSVYSQVRLSPRICLRESISTPFNRLFRQPAGLSLLRLHVTP